jgi:hypothetical protein
MSGEFPRRMFPCDECPIRADNADNPKSKFPAHRWAELSASVRRDGCDPGLHTPMFGCHKGAPGTNADLACAGWLARFGADHLQVRLAVITGHLPATALQPGENWPPLHETWDDVVSAQTLTREAQR